VARFLVGSILNDGWLLMVIVCFLSVLWFVWVHNLDWLLLVYHCLCYELLFDNGVHRLGRMPMELKSSCPKMLKEELILT
jgi:hypothetical protein